MTTVIEWGTEYMEQPGNYQRFQGEMEARASAEAFPQWQRLTRRTVTYTDWEYVE